jgi:CheY-like chemotaxis protein
MDMVEILIADTSKSGLVMTSEVFKDRMPGAIVTTCATGRECLEKVGEKKFDMVVIDFDLPDTDGVTLTKLLRAHFVGPILITAFPGTIVKKAISEELYAFQDSSMWIEKPVKFEALSAKIEHFLIEKRRLHKRFMAKTKATLTLAAGKTKKMEVTLLNLSFGGALLEITEKNTLKVGDEIVLQVHEEKAKKTKVASPTPVFSGLSRVKATIAWTDKRKAQTGLKFEKLSKLHEKNLEELFRRSKEYP